MSQAIYHASVEGAQHGAKNLADFLAYAKASGASGVQPSNYMLQDKDGGLHIGPLLPWFQPGWRWGCLQLTMRY